MYSLDRIESNKAVLIDAQDNTIIIDADFLPKDAKEGDILFKQNESFVVNKELTKSKQEELKQKLFKLSKQ